MEEAYDIRQGDCREVMREMPENSVDAIVTDPPYGLSFMGKEWDHGVPGVQFWKEALRVAKPGAHLLAFGGTRTFHRLTCAIEDAGWEIRDCVMWVYSQGFPKSLDIGKSLDAAEKKRWLDVCKALDSTDQSAILAAWKEYSRTANGAGLSFAKSETATGTNTPESGSVPANVLLQANPESSDAVAVVAELSSIEALRTSEVNCNSAQSLAENSTTESRNLATSAASPPASLAATLDIPDSSALQSAWGWQGESTADKLKAVEALKIWLGSKPSLRQEATSALCVALTDDLKRIILSRSKTFLSLDMTRQMACASAISVTITEFMAASLISFTADTLRNKAIDKAAGAEREVVGQGPNASRRPSAGNGATIHMPAGDPITAPAPATDAARQWSGWGTALKPAWEPVIVARKPLIGNVAENVLAHGTGGINVDGCRVEGSKPDTTRGAGGRNGRYSLIPAQGRIVDDGLGRWPANVIHDGSDEVVGLFPVQVKDGEEASAARFFYCAKASKADRDEGCEGLALVTHQSGMGGAMPVDDDGNARDRFKAQSRNHHPTVKPTELMRYLCRLVTPPGGVVLDPFTGSGSTGKAAILEGFRFIGIDLNPEYIEIARGRVAQAAREATTLF
jgi:DNA modification methylase